jgi:hypothetical protein
MRTIRDCFGHTVRLTDERLEHILEHPEMKGLGAEIERVLIQPQTVTRSISDHGVRLFDEFHAQTIVGFSIVYFAMEEWFRTIGVLRVPFEIRDRIAGW